MVKGGCANVQICRCSNW